MMVRNPYAQQLGSQDARAVLASTPGLLHQAIDALSEDQRLSPIAPGKWSPREIIAHLADCELAFSFRMRQTLAAPVGEPAQLQPFDQTAWSQHYAAYDLPSAFELFRANRAWNLKLVGTLSQADLAHEASHPERGALTFEIILETIAGHDLNHLVQLQQLSAPNA